MNWRDKLEFTGVCLAAVGLLLLTTQLGSYWRFGDVDEWAYAVLDHGSPAQWCVLAYLAALIVCLSVRE
jgi:hypothetical protein